MGKGARKRQRSSRWRRGAALLPLAVLSGALSANASTGDGPARPTAAPTRPAMPAVPDSAFDQPASVAMPGGAMPGLMAGLAPESSFTFPTGDAPSSYRPSMSVAGIPAGALAAYRRAEAILDRADPACNIDWTLIAAIGRVESDHGRYGGNALDAQGVAQPGIYGVALDGSGGTARILDTDGGAYDNDAVFDRAVGPMQFIPSTWSVAGVDADQDGVKNPQDIDDAATATGVYLCAGSDDLSTDAGRRAAVYRYNHSTEYVNLVLSLAAAYAGGDYTAVPNGTPSATTLVPANFVADGRPAGGGRNRPSGGGSDGSTSGGTASAGSVSDSDGGGSGGSGGDSSSGDGSDSGGSGSGDDGGDGGGSPAPSAPDPVGDAVDTVRDTVNDTVNDTVDRVTQPAPAPVTDPIEEARAYCASQPLGAISLSRCIDAYLSGGASAVQNLLDGGLGLP
jgi:membrane-bound lytic murein transglycosylase B